MFQPVTTGRDGKVIDPKRKEFTWSYSRLKNYRACPKKHYHVDIAKDFKEAEGEALTRGNEIHKAMADRVANGKPLPALLAEFEPEAQSVLASVQPGDLLLVEQNIAIKRDFTAAGYFEPGVWYRAKSDVVKVRGDVAAAIDWKTGKIQEDNIQLALMAACVFAAYPKVMKILTRYVWLGNHAKTDLLLTRDDMVKLWNVLLPEVAGYEEAVKMTNFPPKPSGLCKAYCPVTSCPYHGKGNR